MVARYVLANRWIAPAFVAGATLGAAVVATVFGASLLSTSPAAVPGLWLIAFIIAFVIWGFGLVLVGGPIWYFAEEKGRRSPVRAVWSGMAATFAAMAVLALFGSLGAIRSGWREWLMTLAYSLPSCLLMALLGGAVAALVWRVAYRRVRGG